MATELPCVELSTTPSGRAPVVTDDENCLVELIQANEANYPAIAEALSDDEYELRDGSAEFPFVLPNLQVQTGGSFTKMMIQDSNGVWFVYEPGVTCLNQRMLIVEGEFTFEDDLLPEMLLADICEITSCDGYDWLLGLKEEVIECDDEDDITVFRLVKVPKNLVPTCVE